MIMKKRNLLLAFLLLFIIGAAATTATAQQNVVMLQNNTVMNRYTYTPEAFQRGTSTSEVKMFPNPARSQTTVYINSIKEADRGEMVVYNNKGKVVLRNPVALGNNDLNVAQFSTGVYVVKIFTRDKSVYTKQLVVMK